MGGGVVTGAGVIVIVSGTLMTGLGGASIGKDVFLSLEVSLPAFAFAVALPSTGAISFVSGVDVVTGVTAGVEVSFHVNAATAINPAAAAIQITLRDLLAVAAGCAVGAGAAFFFAAI